MNYLFYIIAFLPPNDPGIWKEIRQSFACSHLASKVNIMCASSLFRIWECRHI